MRIAVLNILKTHNVMDYKYAVAFLNGLFGFEVNTLWHFRVLKVLRCSKQLFLPAISKIDRRGHAFLTNIFSFPTGKSIAAARESLCFPRRKRKSGKNKSKSSLRLAISPHMRSAVTWALGDERVPYQNSLQNCMKLFSVKISGACETTAIEQSIWTQRRSAAVRQISVLDSHIKLFSLSPLLWGKEGFLLHGITLIGILAEASLFCRQLSEHTVRSQTRLQECGSHVIPVRFILHIHSAVFANFGSNSVWDIRKGFERNCICSVIDMHQFSIRKPSVNIHPSHWCTCTVSWPCNASWA